MSKNILVVESENDKFFLEAFVGKLTPTIDVEATPFCRIDDFECLEGDSSNKLIAALTALRNRARKEEIINIGIVLDQDNKTAEDRIKQVNTAIAEAFGTTGNVITVLGELVAIAIDEDTSLNIGLYLQNVNGVGNLETVLMAIKNKDSRHADCLEAWRQCVEEHGFVIKDGDFNKFWVAIYQRYDQCSKKERKQAGRKCNNEVSMRKAIWNFNHETLGSLKVFLQKFELQKII